MTTKPEKTIRSLLNNNNGQLGQLLKKNQQLETINALVQPLLDEELALHCQVANFREGCLVLQADSAAWATRLRYQIPVLLQALRTPDRLPNIATIRLIVR